MQLTKNASRTTRKVFLRITIFLAIGLVVSTESTAKEWRGIIPLHSTRVDVEKLAGHPTAPGGSLYYLAEETLTVVYSDGPCAGDNLWNVPKDTVISMRLIPRAKRFLKDLNLNLAEYEKRPDFDMGDKRHYVNNKDGQIIGVDEPSGLIDYIAFYPTAQDHQDNVLRCLEKLPKQQIVDKGNLVGRFSDYWAEDTQEVLDVVEAKAKFDPRATIYIVFSGKDDQSGKIRLFADLAKQYLIKQQIKSERIILMDDKVYRKGFVEVWFSPER